MYQGMNDYQSGIEKKWILLLYLVPISFLDVTSFFLCDQFSLSLSLSLSLSGTYPSDKLAVNFSNF